MKFNNRLCLALTVLFASTSAATASAGVSDEDWIIFEDFVSGAECGVIHTSNAEFVALFDSGNMVIVSGADVRFDSLVVTSDDQVLFNGEPSGLIEFLDDGDYAAAKAFLDENAELDEHADRVIASMTDIPVDIQPVYPDEL